MDTVVASRVVSIFFKNLGKSEKIRIRNATHSIGILIFFIGENFQFNHLICQTENPIGSKYCPISMTVLITELMNLSGKSRPYSATHSII